MDEERTDEPIDDFDETNDKAPGLDGDDGGALTGDNEERHGVLTDLVRDLDSDFQDRKDDRTDEDGETPYSEEGRP